MNRKQAITFRPSAALFRIALVLLLLCTSGSIAIATPNLQSPEGEATGASATDANGNAKPDKPHKHDSRKEQKLASPERKGPHPQQQQEIKPPKPQKQRAEGEPELVDETIEQPYQLFLPVTPQDGDPSVQAQTDVWPGDLVQAAAVVKTVDLKVLVIAADGNETDFPAITAFLSQIGIPYDTLVGTQTQLTWDKLSNGYDHGYYQGIILTTGNLGYLNPATNQWESVFDGNEWYALWTYETMFGIRQVTSYTYPGGWPDSYGLNLVSYTTSPINATLTAAGQQIYPYLKPNVQIAINNTWTYLATVINPAVTTPLVTSGNYAIAAIHKYSDGRQNLAITAGNNPYLLHSLLLSYGTINWVTKGLFLGERHAYINPQVDDLLIDSDMWSTTALTDTTGLLFRMSGNDLNKVITWQNNTRATYPFASTLTLEMAYNGEGATGIYPQDTLTPAVIANQSKFYWVSHTFTHANLDQITYADTTTELTRNHQTALTMAFTKYYKDAMVQPDISGLYNGLFHNAAKDFGIKYLISDTSQPAWNNPSPNTGYYSTFQPSILIIPRRPTNLFYNLRTPAEWVSEYNCFYGPAGTCAGGRFRFWSQNLTYAQILDKEANMWLQYLLKWDVDPLMFHQANLGAYNGTNSLLGDLINATLAKYNAVSNLPIIGINQHDVGVKMANRMAYNASGVRASMIPCQSITLTTNQPALIPMTGITYGTNTEVYGGQSISYIQLGANQSLTIPAPACS